MRKFVCIKKYTNNFEIGKCYSIESELSGFCKINNNWFSNDINLNLSPFIGDFFISISEHRKNKLNNINSKILK